MLHKLARNSNPFTLIFLSVEVLDTQISVLMYWVVIERGIAVLLRSAFSKGPFYDWMSQPIETEKRIESRPF